MRSSEKKDGRILFAPRRAYNKGMNKVKRIVLAATMAVVMAFVAAVSLCVRALRAPVSVFSASQSGMKIVLDAGHGGIDGGVTGAQTGVKESDLNLQITLLLKTELEGMGFEVALTRKTDSGLYGTTAKGFKKRDMQRRKEIILEEQPSMVISLHQNRFATKSTRGAQVFYRKSSVSGKKLALALQQQLNDLYETQGVKHRKATAGEFFMLDIVDAPSVIIECGFLSSPLDEALLIDGAWQKKLVQNIAAGVMVYLSDSVS